MLRVDARSERQRQRMLSPDRQKSTSEPSPRRYGGTTNGSGVCASFDAFCVCARGRVETKQPDDEADKSSSVCEQEYSRVNLLHCRSVAQGLTGCTVSRFEK